MLWTLSLSTLDAEPRQVACYPYGLVIQHLEGSLESEVFVDIHVRMVLKVNVDWAAQFMRHPPGFIGASDGSEST